MDLFVDFETRSKLSPSKIGLFNYASDPSTLPLMLAYGTRKESRQWSLTSEQLSDMNESPIRPECPDDLADMARDESVTFHAHNAGFEISIWSVICAGRWGWPEIPANRWRCTMAKAAHSNMPQSLDKLSKRLGLADDQKKSDKGKELIRLLCLPTKAQKTYKRARKGADGKSIKDQDGRVVYDANKKSLRYAEERGWSVFPGNDGNDYFFCEDREALAELQAYNLQDIVAEMAADERLPSWPEEEQQLWAVDQIINNRGIPIDVPLCRGALKVYDMEVEDFHAEIEALTDGAVERCSCVQALTEWVNSRVDFGDSLSKERIEEFLVKYHDPDTWAQVAYKDTATEMPKVLRALTLRLEAGGTAVAKYAAAVHHVSEDGRARGQLIYHKAATGRWAGKGIQPHNMAREKILDDTFTEAITTGNRDIVAAMGDLYGLDVLTALKKCVRGAIRAPLGRKLVVSDFAGIENRVLNWLVTGKEKLRILAEGQDPYIHAATSIYGKTIEEIATVDDSGKWTIRPECKHMRAIGKVAELALQYGMGWSTFLGNARKAGQSMDEDFAQLVVSSWRAANPKVVKFWYDLERACRHVIRRNGDRVRLCGGKIHVWWHGRGYLCIRLPSGRSLFYYRPRIDDATGNIMYLDGGKLGRPSNGYAIDTYSGKLVENVVQAVARDMLASAILSLHRDLPEGADIIFHVHDEVVVETDRDDAQTFHTVHEAMTTLPDWAKGMPIGAETYESERYTK